MVRPRFEILLVPSGSTLTVYSKEDGRPRIHQTKSRSRVNADGGNAPNSDPPVGDPLGRKPGGGASRDSQTPVSDLSSQSCYDYKSIYIDR